MTRTIPLISRVINANENGRSPTCTSISEEVKNARMPTTRQMIPGTIHFDLNVLQPFAIQSVEINDLCMSNHDSKIWLMMQNPSIVCMYQPCSMFSCSRMRASDSSTTGFECVGLNERISELSEAES